MAQMGNSIYATFMEAQVAAEEARKSSLESRGLAVITTSGVLSTLSFASLALAKTRDALTFPGASVPLVVIGVIALLVAAVLALITNIPLRYRTLKPAEMLGTMRDHWGDEDEIALARVTASRARLLGSTRSANDLKALVLLAAMGAEVLGVSMLASTAAVVIIGAR